jgi:DNA-binding XRE family transcriptional regulator
MMKRNRIVKVVVYPEDAKVLSGYRKAQELNKAAFAAALGISKQRAHSWLAGHYRPSTDWLISASLREGWQGSMAQELLKARGLVVAERISA